jgi:hypothetical protein
MTDTPLISGSSARRVLAQIVQRRWSYHVTQTHRPSNPDACHVRHRDGSRRGIARGRAIAVVSLVRPGGQHHSMLVHDARAMRRDSESSWLLRHRSERGAPPWRHDPPRAVTSGLRTDFQARQPATSSLVGKRPVAFFENANRPSTRISKTPPLDRRRFICAEGRSLRISFSASRARGS